MPRRTRDGGVNVPTLYNRRDPNRPRVRCSVMHVRPALPADLDFIVTANMRLAEETEQVLLDEPTLREGVLAIFKGLAPGRYWLVKQEARAIGQLLITF